MKKSIGSIAVFVTLVALLAEVGRSSRQARTVMHFRGEVSMMIRTV